ncbi:SpoIIE family protein phosphatase [Actinospica sp.]|uniref:SpoIIE family protein phosphatase n=1 Tax=Actinospica sp. TaxID=1872142 RepID=UPI002BD6742E|nr:SpoIIE family protein phosphatase [Actinospica sp.]HWG26214.1 SpoIIE family protein phosphatase [Actinospica sp.]
MTVATALLQSDGRIVHWSSSAEALLGYSAAEAVGSYAIGLIGVDERRAEILELYDGILRGEEWSGTYPVRHRNGDHVELELHTYRIDAGIGPPMVLATAVDARAVRQVEADLAVLDSFFSQSPVGMAVYDDELRFVRVNAALAEANGLPVAEHLGRRVDEVLPGPAAALIETQLRQVLATGESIVDARTEGPGPGRPGNDHTWSASYSRLQDAAGRVFGISSSVIDITERQDAEKQASRARERLVVLAEAGTAIRSTLDLSQAGESLVEAMVPELADVCSVYVLERQMMDGGAAEPLGRNPFLVRRVAFSAEAEDFPREEFPIGQLHRLEPGSPYAEALRQGRTMVVAPSETPWVIANPTGRLATFYARRSRPVRVVPLVARGSVLGFVSYTRRESREPLDEQDITLGDELAARAAVAIDNALLYRRERETALARQEALRQANAAQGRLALLNDASVRIGTTLDLQRTAEELVEVVLPRFADFATVDLLVSVVRGDEPGSVSLYERVVLQAVAAGEAHPSGLRSIADTVGEISTFDSAKGYARSLRTGRPLVIPVVDEESLRRIASVPERVAPGLAAGVHSYLMVPLRARGVVLGGAEFIRMQDREPFGQADVALAEELTARAALCIDNARLYRRERATALTLQRSLLPQDVHRTLGTDIAHRYLPSSVVSEVGGDWFDVVPLSCGRVALVVGDVMGHGIRAAATMGQLRTVARTLATLDMDPEQVLTRLDEVAASSGDDQFATCVCAVYDPVERSGVIASAGHLPPVTVAPDGTTRLIDVLPGAPLGVGGVPFESVEFSLPERSILALYTDGLVERRGRDLDEGIDLLRHALTGHGRSLEEQCDAVLSALLPSGGEDDVALIMAKAVPLDPERIATLALSDDRRVAGQARRFTQATLRDWGLTALTELAELLVSELVTNALTHADRPRQLRLFRDRTLTVEVADSDAQRPIQRGLTDYEEGGRGIQLVDQLARRWGSRATRHGKVVWFELEPPSGWPG